MPLSQEIINAIQQRAALILGDVLSGKSWEQIRNDANLTAELYGAIIDELLGKDNQTIATALKEALADGNLNADDVANVLGAWVLAQTGGDEAVGKLIQALSDGKITDKEAGDIILFWANRQTKDPTIKAFLNVFSAGPGGIDADPAKLKAQILAYLATKSGLPAELTDPIVAAIEADKIDAGTLLKILAGWATASGSDRLSSLLAQLAAEGQNPRDIAIVMFSWLSGESEDNVRTALELVQKGEFFKLLAMVLGALEPNLGNSLITQLLNGQYREAAVAQITALLKSLGVNEAGDLATALIDLALGSRSLFARPEETGLPFGKNAAAVAVWHDCQAVMYLAELFAADQFGSLVSTDPQAKPILVTASEITYDSPASVLLTDPADAGKRGQYDDVLTKMLDRHFLGKILPFGPSRVLPQAAFAKGSGNSCGDVVISVFGQWMNPL